MILTLHIQPSNVIRIPGVQNWYVITDVDGYWYEVCATDPDGNRVCEARLAEGKTAAVRAAYDLITELGDTI